MDFSWEAMEDADRRVKQLRHRMADWGPAAPALGEAATAFDSRFREAVANDLDMPSAVVVTNELASAADVPGAEKYALLASWDSVLGIDIEREARSGWTAPEEALQLIEQRDEARAARDFAAADQLRDRLQDMGFEVMDTPEGTKIRPRD
jgi:cysteinyl-tRNA synthetase